MNLMTLALLRVSHKTGKLIEGSKLAAQMPSIEINCIFLLFCGCKNIYSLHPGIASKGRGQGVQF